MRLLKYIKEDQFDEAQAQVVKDIIKTLSDSRYSEALKFVKKQLNKLASPAAFESHWNHCFFYRGISSVESIIEKKPRMDRRPKDSHIKLTAWMDDAFESKFHWRPRSEGVFATGSGEMANGYGHQVYMFFPSNGFKFIWSPEISDIYRDLHFGDYYDTETPSIRSKLFTLWLKKYDVGLAGHETEEGFWEPEVSFDDYLKTHDETWKEKIEAVVKKDYKSTDLEAAMRSGHEVMFKCDKYCATVFQHYLGSIGAKLAKHIRYEL